eukprot:11227703-Lingulodinium_polyedra.AAC.1
MLKRGPTDDPPLPRCARTISHMPDWLSIELLVHLTGIRKDTWINHYRDTKEYKHLLWYALGGVAEYRVPSLGM